MIQVRLAAERSTRNPAISILAVLAVGVYSTATAENDARDESSAEPPAIHALLKKPRDSLFSVSPDGSKVFYIQWSPSGYYMVVHDAKNGEQIQDIPFGKRRPDSIHWLTSRRVLYSRGGQIFAVDMDGTNFMKLLSNYDSDRGSNYRRNFRAWSVKHLLPNDPEHILVQSWNFKGHPAIVKANIYTGEERELVYQPKLDINNWAVDRKGDVRLGIRFKKDELQFLALNKENGRWEIYDDYAQDGANTLGHTGETYLTRRINLEAFDYDNDHIYMATNRNSDRFKIVKYNISEKKVVEDVYVSDRYDVGGSDSDNTRLLFHDAEEKLVGIRLDEEKRRTIWFDERFRKYQQFVDEFRPDYENRIIDWSDDTNTLLVFSSSDVDPGRYSIFHPSTKKLFTIAIINEDLPSGNLSKTEMVKFTARDGYTLHGYVNPAIGETKGLIVLPHGGPWSRDDWSFNARVQYFATRGYNVLRINFRGSIGFGREHVLAGVKNIDTLMIDDIADGVHWAIQQNFARADSVYIFGHSYGGYAALMSTVRYPDLYSAAVAWSAPVDMLAQIKKYKKDDAFFAYEFWKTAAGDPKKERKTLMRISPINNTGEMRVPLLVFHGELDGVIPEEDIERFKTQLQKAGNRAEVHIIDNEGHTFSNNNNITYVLEKSLRHFSQYAPVEKTN